MLYLKPNCYFRYIPSEPVRDQYGMSEVFILDIETNIEKA